MHKKHQLHVEVAKHLQHAKQNPKYGQTYTNRKLEDEVDYR